jgi:putative nucleotidyltransferase with HDIG domain
MNDPQLLRVMFVDDESRILQGLQRMLRPLRDEWDMQFVDSGEAALRAMAASPVDVVVSDMRMPLMSGAELLTRVMRDHPATVRLILSGQAEKELVHKTVGPTHQYLSKPCDAETLKATVDRAAKLRRLLSDDRLRLLTAQLNHLPSLPSLYLKLVELLQCPGSTLAAVGELVATDLGMSMKILQLVNSAFFGLRRTVSSPVEAVNLLGIETIQSLVLSSQVFSRIEDAQVAEFALDALWDHSLAVSVLAKRIAQAEGLEKPQVEAAFMAAMMHDVGRVVLATNLPREYAAVMKMAKDQRRPLIACEREVLGATHAEVGAYLLGLWGISEPIVEAVAHHHAPRDVPTRIFSPVTAVHVADALHHALSGTSDSGSIEAAHLNDLGLGARLPAWIELAGAAANKGGRHA